MKTYYAPRETFSTHLGGDFYAVLNPYVQNPVAVITGSALRILKVFRNGKTLEELRERFPDAALGELRSLVRGLASAHLLFTTSTPRRLKRAPKSLGVRFHITNRCNLACRYCYVDRTAEDMSVKTARRSFRIPMPLNGPCTTISCAERSRTTKPRGA